jgi:hypothetical protein
MGPWSILAALSLPLPAVFGLKGHSLVFDTGNVIPGEALFIEYREPAGAALSPEIFPRADGTTYVCAISSKTPLPIDPAQVGPDPATAGAVRGGVAPSEGAKKSAQGARPGDSVFLVSDFALPCRSVLRCRSAALQELEDAAWQVSSDAL